MHKPLLTILAILTVIVVFSTSAAAFDGGDGSEADPYQISTAGDLKFISGYSSIPDKHYILTADIDMAGFEFTKAIINSGGSYFSGTFDGKGHTISNLTIDISETDPAQSDSSLALFSCVGSGGEISNINMAYTRIIGKRTSSNYVAGLCGINCGSIDNCNIANINCEGFSHTAGLCGGNAGQINDCIVTGIIDAGDYSGGICGLNAGTISNCGFSGNVFGQIKTGGICGENGDAGQIEFCWTGGLVKDGDSNSTNHGGICGYSSGVISNCDSDCLVDSFDGVGGICGQNLGTITLCGSLGDINGNNYVGGLAGFNFGIINKSYCRGDVHAGNYAGGLVGGSDNLNIENCYSSGAVSTTSGQNCGGFCSWSGATGDVISCYWDVPSSNCPDSIFATGLTSEQMQMQSSYDDWDFADNIDDGDENNWEIIEGSDYPTLTWQRELGTIIVPAVSSMTQQQARIAIESAGLNVGQIQYDYSLIIEKDVIIKQSPKSGSRVLDNTAIDIVVSLGRSEQMPFNSGNGSALHPFEITNSADLIELGANPKYYSNFFIMTADIDLQGQEFTSPIIGPDENTPFAGGFNGNGFTVSNCIITSSVRYVGLFGNISGPDSIVENLNLDNIVIDGGRYRTVGGLCGKIIEGSIINCNGTALEMTGDCAGGLIGRGSSATIDNCSVDSGSVNGVSGGGLCGSIVASDIVACNAKMNVISDSYDTENVGGLLGYSNNCNITDCYSAGDVTVGEGRLYIGGLCGQNENSKITNSYSHTKITAGDKSENIGGFVGFCVSSSIQSCYSDAEVFSGEESRYTGGFCGTSLNSNISNNYSLSDVFGGSNAAGFVGQVYNGLVSCCYAVGKVDSGYGYGNGFVGAYYYSDDIFEGCFWDVTTSRQRDSHGGMGLRTDRMQIALPYQSTGWDLAHETANGTEDIWKFTGENTYPVLTWQYPDQPALQFVPDLTGMDPGQAGAAIIQAGFVVGQISYAHSVDVAGSLVCDYTKMAIPGGIVDGTISLGLAEGELFSGGTGTEADPYRLSTAEDFIALNKSSLCYDKYFIMTNDIDLGRYCFETAVIAPSKAKSGSQFQGTKFSGCFNGNGYVISNLTINVQADDWPNDDYNCYLGLFGAVDGENARIENLGIIHPNIKGGTSSDYIGCLCASVFSGTIDNCYVKGYLSLYFNMFVIDGDDYVGGFIGYNSGQINNCYSQIHVKDGSSGFCCENINGTITNCYSVYSGFCKINTGGQIIACGWDIDNAQNNTNTLGVGLTTEQMQDADIFENAGWDFSDIDGNTAVWFMPENSYPILNWQTNTPFDGGDGSADNPYQISTAGQLIFINAKRYLLNKHYILTNDIDLSQYQFTNAVIAPGLGIIWRSEGRAFSGVFDGNGHKILNLNINTFDDNNPVNDREGSPGLFGLVQGKDALVKNLAVVNVAVNADMFVRIGNPWNPFWENAAGLCSGLIGGTIQECYVTGKISGAMSVGGICGSNNGTIRNCYNEAKVSGSAMAGGLCGYNHNSFGNGYTEGMIINCYSTGSVYGQGAFCGDNDGTIYNCFWNIDTAGLQDSDGGTGLTTQQMMQAASYIGWNDGTWTIDQGNDYPRLAWENKPGMVITTGYPDKTYAGEGTETNPYQLACPVDLLCLTSRRPDWDKYIILVADIDMAEIDDYMPIEHFTGSLDGQNYAIRNLEIAPELLGLDSYLGLIRKADNCQISNLSLIDYKLVNVDHMYFAGALCGYANMSTISNCYTSGTVYAYGLRVGGICSSATNSTITDCHSSCNVLGGSRIGGICSSNYNGIINNCSFDGYLTGIDCVSNPSEAGGICSYNTGTISNCYCTGSLNLLTKWNYVGGICGQNRGLIQYCYASGVSIEGADYIGGLCGGNIEATIENCYAVDSVIKGDEYGGGLVGQNEDGYIAKSYTDNKVSGTNYIDGFCGSNTGDIFTCYWNTETSGLSSSNNCTGLTTAQMQDQTIFESAGWDFTDIWWMPEGSYPLLSWQRNQCINPQLSDINNDCLVNSNDLLLLIQQWTITHTGGAADINDDTQVNLEDFAIMTNHWLTCSYRDQSLCN
ncbi:MAG: PASTA domain-containing protein [Phycisphaerae bacterium]|nr:PASTA domain-containing protein [Phycisphaerae bacterium]